MSTPLLEIRDLCATVGEDTPILKGLDLVVNRGEVHAIMGPNGAGKSTLGNILSGKDGYTATQGSVLLDGKDVLAMEPDERANEGLFLAFQYPVEIPGVGNHYFLKAAMNAKRRFHGEDELDAGQFLRMMKKKMQLLEMDARYKSRDVNVGFSGGEKKRNEILQMTLLNPKLAVLDETDSGLDIDALRIVSKGVSSMRDDEHGMIVITHYQRLLDHIEPDFVHVLVDGRIVKSGDKSLALELEEKGYAEYEATA
ncbi:MAG: Fe-S cluster assembly ATPase SufC [Deltaproteobacteria bacterium]|nr:Fe-S cluster assembly ATPase SufC [Deltaproteobacteria bacterium]